MNMDRFRFRVFDPDNNRMVYIPDHIHMYVQNDEGHFDTEIIRDILFNHWFNINLDEQVKLMQCTGLKDSEGNLMYEGDILGAVTEGGATAQLIVKWDDKEAGFTFEALFRIDDSICESPKIIGNRYENPELLKEK